MITDFMRTLGFGRHAGKYTRPNRATASKGSGRHNRQRIQQHVDKRKEKAKAKAANKMRKLNRRRR
jgi:hypothetical protein